MIALKLKPRLEAVASLVSPGKVAADIGTDHAYLPVYLVTENVCLRVIAVEKSPLNCRRARETVMLFNLEEKIEVRAGDGLLALTENDNVEVVVIAGIGGRTICRMLMAAGDSLKRYKLLVLQPMGDAPLLRRWLVAHGYCMHRERLAKENERFYEVIAAKRGRQIIDDPILWELGPALLEEGDLLLVPWLQYRLKRYEAIMHGLLQSRQGEEDPRWRYYEHCYTRLKGVLESVCRGE